MEFLRFGSSIPGSYWGCCAFDIIQDFSQDPDAPASIEIVDGDSCIPMGGFLGKTWREVFESRLVIGTFSDDPLPNHGFLAIMTETQFNYLNGNGKKWLKILKENGFEFIRCVDNSVYSCEIGCQDEEEDDCYDGPSYSVNRNYLFGLFRNVGPQPVKNPFEPPKAWAEIGGEGVESVTTHYSQDNLKAIADSQKEFHAKKWAELEDKFTVYTQKQLEKDGVPIWMAGRRSDKPQQLLINREEVEEQQKKDAPQKKAAPF